MRLIEDKIKENYERNKEEIITVFLALQRQNFVMGNSLNNLIRKWPIPPITEEEALKSGILFEIKD
tara:strand:- start:237 stop:434 length:198 start_codon:yes stop_codon:yes gene_type:complete